ncbi:MAG: nucleotide 5'-monophosphate nucleosidase PpnN [Succinivibrio sp.]|nr:nucleotide 5'-monophosphate nucleosidase PpnN [Succinivibrio sp.]
MSIEVVWPSGSMSLLTQIESDRISHTSKGPIYDLYRNCSLAVLNSGNLTDNSKELLDNYESFDINVIRNERGLKIELINPPPTAFVDGEIISTLGAHLYSVLRDIVQISQHSEFLSRQLEAQGVSKGEIFTTIVFSILRNAQVLKTGIHPNIAVCWGGHSISAGEYEYAYEVGYALGLRGIDICTGCGPGIMEAPMKGSVLGHALQQNSKSCRLIGLTEPSIIAAEPPNLMTSELVILPDIEKRLEAFVRLGHVMMIFPGGPGTAEELLYILAIKLHPENRRCLLPLILTCSNENEAYFTALEKFLKVCFGNDISRQYRKIIGNPNEVAVEVKQDLKSVLDYRNILHDSYCFNWGLQIPTELQQPFEVNHDQMAALNLHKDQEPWRLATALRAAFSGIVTGSVKEYGAKMVAEKGPFKLHGDKEIITAMQELLQSFIDQKRFFLSGREYQPCFELES